MPRIIKGVPIGSQAEKLVKVRRELARAEELTRVEQIELEARQKAETILSDARSEAEKILADSKKQAETIKTDARKQGDAQAKKEALERLAGLITSIEKEINILRTARSEFLKNNMEGIIEFSCALAERILVTELKIRPEALAKRAMALIDRMPPGCQVTLCVNPEDLDVIERYLHDGGGPSNRILPALRSDPCMPMGNLRLESDLGLIDAGLLDSLEDIEKLLIEQARSQMNSGSGGHPYAR
jgi:flagellar assembly protein FliH